MKRTHTIVALSLAALLAGGTTAMALTAEPASTPADTSLDPQKDETGFRIFGFNVAFAGNTPSAVQNFVAGLSPDQQQRVQTGCGEVLSDAGMASNFTVVQFCRNATL
jgi:hypothetical protein